MIQVIYISTARRDAVIGVDQILSTSQINNRKDDVTGLLYFDGVRFLQALEGPVASVERAYDRIEKDERHFGLVVLSRRAIEAREFGDWAMAQRLPGDDGDEFVGKIAGLLSNTSPNVRATFEAFAKLRRAA